MLGDDQRVQIKTPLQILQLPFHFTAIDGQWRDRCRPALGEIVPLAAGVFWKRATTVGAVLSVVFGLVSWTIAELTAAEATVPPQLVGLAFSIVGMVLGSLVPRAAAAPAVHPHGKR